MKIIHYISGLVLLMGLMITSPARADVFQEFPRTGTTTLSNGTSVSLPFYLFDYDQVALIGTANLTQLNNALQGQGVTPLVGLNGVGVGTVAVYTIHYRSTDWGAYDETIVAVAVEPRNVLNPRLTFYVHAISVTQQLPLLVGVELLGLPKQLDNITYSNANNNMLLNWKDANNQNVVALNCAGCNSLLALPARLDFDVASPLDGNGNRIWSRIVADANTTAKPYLPILGDTFSYNAQSNVGSFLQQVQFTPLSWLIGKQVKAVDLIYP